jgi:uncharacterized protein (TIGR02231 family)
MRALGIVSIASLFLFSFAAICTGMEIRKAVIYDDLAYISFDKTIHGQAVIEAPPDMVSDSLTVVPLKKGILRSVSVEPSRAVSGKVKELENALSKKKSSLNSTRKAQALVEKQIEIIYDSAGSKGKATAFDKSRLAEALGFIDSRVTGLNNRLVALSDKVAKLEMDIKDLQDQLRTTNKNPGYKINITADGVAEISYAVRGVSWAPQYRVLASPDKNKLAIELSAQVRQSSSQDWDVRELFISTGRPGFGIQAPELQPWYLSKPPKNRPMKAMAKALDKELVPSVQEETEPRVETTTTSFLVGVARNIHLPGDGTACKMQVTKQFLDAEFTRITIPRYSPQVYLRAESVLKGDLPLVSGPYLSFVDGVFSGKGDLNRTDPEQKIKLDLGIDEGIKVERKELKVFHEKTFTGKDKTTYT